MYGTSVVLLARLPPTPSELTTIIEKLHVTFVSLPPLLIDQLVTYLNETQAFAPWQKLKILLYGGAALKKTTGDYLHNHGINVRNAYGSTGKSIRWHVGNAAMYISNLLYYRNQCYVYGTHDK